MLAEIAIQVGRPKFRFPTSENACPESFLNFVQRMTSHGASAGSASEKFWTFWLAIVATDDCRECVPRKAGEMARGELKGEEERRVWNRRSNGRWEEVGLRLEIGL